ncbi:hypothetical protein [Kribbella sp. NPDC051620]|uniref:hypothetical protein n=1 Tax=Kribbella sp. NPDC051620 TaxID=3364120 RepID=UPI0037B09704
MTDLLKDTLTQRADLTEPPPLDLDAIISIGDRRLRHRRVATIAGTALITLAVLITSLTLIKPSEQPAPASVPFTERRATYAVGSEIHFGPDVISTAPYKLRAFVQTNSGFVFTRTDGGSLFLADGKQVRRIGSGPGNLGALTVSGDGNLVGWVEALAGRDESVIYDVAAGRELVRTPIGNQRGPLVDPVSGPRIIAIDGDYAYFGTYRGVYRWNLKTGQAQTVGKNLSPNAIRTVANLRHLYQIPLIVPGEGTSIAVADNPSDDTLHVYPGQQGWLSPTADYLLTAPNDPGHVTPPPAPLRLFHTATGKELTLTHPGHPRLIFSQWLTNDTFTAVGLRPAANKPHTNSPVDLLTCSTKSLTCSTTTPAFSTYTFTQTPAGTTTPFALPIGTPIYRLNR